MNIRTGRSTPNTCVGRDSWELIEPQSEEQTEPSADKRMQRRANEEGIFASGAPGGRGGRGALRMARAAGRAGGGAMEGRERSLYLTILSDAKLMPRNLNKCACLKGRDVVGNYFDKTFFFFSIRGGRERKCKNT